MTKPFFSVVIPLFNKRPYILRAINSVLNQTYQNFEIIVIDDGSTDGGGNLVWEIKDPRIRVIKQTNKGVSSARNRGVHESNADFVTFLDADDEWEPNLLKVFIEMIKEFPDCVLYSQSFMIKKKKSLFKPKLFNKYQKNYKGILNEYLDLAPYGQAFNTSSVCIPKKLLEDIGGFPKNVKLGEDLSVWLDLFFLGKFAFCNSFNAIYYLDNKDNVSSNSKLDFGFFEQKLENYLKLQRSNAAKWNSLYEYYTSRILVICTQKLLLGKQKECRKLLAKCKDTKKFNKRWILKFTYSYLPTKLYIFLYKQSKT